MRGAWHNRYDRPVRVPRVVAQDDDGATACLFACLRRAKALAAEVGDVDVATPWSCGTADHPARLRMSGFA
jgi:hypothetical protein